MLTGGRGDQFQENGLFRGGGLDGQPLAFPKQGVSPQIHHADDATQQGDGFQGVGQGRHHIEQNQAGQHAQNGDGD